VPEEISIIGADNSLMRVDAMRIPISSIDTNLKLVGYRGAALLDALMQDKSAPAEPVRVLPLGLVAINHLGVAKCLRFLHEHGFEPIGVDDLARAAGMSRRALHQAFIEHLGRPPGAELHRLRIEQAKKLLADLAQLLNDIANRCGYQSDYGLRVSFKQATGVSPRQYREQLKV
jgi:LacI family transcriptional regulator